METMNQILLRRFLTHSSHCITCEESKGLHTKMCAIGQAMAQVYGRGRKDVAVNQLTRISKLSWDMLAIASLTADEDPDPIWSVCLDAVIAQKVEVMWQLSEAFWRRLSDSER